MNPYSDQNFFSFIVQLFVRMGAFLTGNLSFKDLASDELQLIVLISVAGSSAIVGTFLVLRRMTMMANSISHTILLGIVIAFVLSKDSRIELLLLAAVGMGIFTSFLTELLTRVAKLQEDASIGLVFTSLFAAGIILATLLTRSSHIGTEAVMGNVDALQNTDGNFVLMILAINVILLFLFYKEYFITTFDPLLAKVLGFSTVFFNYLLMVQVSATIIGAFRAVGVLMVLAFITGPVLTARLLTDQLGKMILYGVGIGALASLIGVALSRHLLTVYGVALSTAGLVVCVILGLFLIVVVCKRAAQSVP